MTNLILSYRGTIYPWHCDHMGHMNVMWYTGKFDEASWFLLGQAGFSRSVLQERNCGLAAVQQNITYKRELRAGDVISVRSGILDIAEKTVQIFHEMRNEETHEIAAFTVVTGVYMDASERKAMPIPLDLRGNIENLKVDQHKLYWEDTLTPELSPSLADQPGSRALNY